jgi:hypothetical protein
MYKYHIKKSIFQTKIFIKYIATYLINTVKWQLESRCLDHIKVGVVIIQPLISELYN